MEKEGRFVRMVATHLLALVVITLLPVARVRRNALLVSALMSSATRWLRANRPTRQRSSRMPKGKPHTNAGTLKGRFVFSQSLLRNPRPIPKNMSAACRDVLRPARFGGSDRRVFPALRLDPRHVGRFEDRESVFGRRRIRQSNPRLGRSHSDRSNGRAMISTGAPCAYFLKEDLDKAMADANRAVSLAPFSADIHYELRDAACQVRGATRGTRGSRPRGADGTEAPKADHDGTCLDRAGKLSFGDSPLVSICQRAGLCHQFGRLREAIALCDEALRLDHNNLDGMLFGRKHFWIRDISTADWPSWPR